MIVVITNVITEQLAGHTYSLFVFYLSDPIEVPSLVSASLSLPYCTWSSVVHRNGLCGRWDVYHRPDFPLIWKNRNNGVVTIQLVARGITRGRGGGSTIIATAIIAVAIIIVVIVVLVGKVGIIKIDLLFVRRQYRELCNINHGKEMLCTSTKRPPPKLSREWGIE